jgi:preprotein translocase subunit SecD
MPLGLDLRGGLYLLYQVDVNSAVGQALEGYAQDARRALTAANISFKDVTNVASAGGRPDTVRIALPPGADVSAARTALTQAFQGLSVSNENDSNGPLILATMTPAKVKEREDYAIQQNITTLRNRVNELGVSEPIVQRQGLDRINVQLPGVQNSAEIKNLLGRVATLEFRLEDTQNNAFEAQQRGRAPLGSKLYTHTRIGRPILLKREIIATGDQLTNATVDNNTGEGGVGVSVNLDARAGEAMLKTTKANLNKPMAVVLIEKHRETSEVDGKPVSRDVTDETVINDATIRGVFSSHFVITGLSAGEARDLALLLRSGSLATAIYVVQERVVGPSVGSENIDKGVTALILGMAGVFAFMAIYYKIFGIVADLVLLANVVLLTALLSMMSASLSLPGIAGIILTVGMAVDANVLIYERIREEIRKGVSPQAAIRAGFEKAFSAIADSNVTTLIAGVVLWIFGTGAIRGFAVVLTLGIVTSMFTSLMGSRALITLMYGGHRKLARLSI